MSNVDIDDLAAAVMDGLEEYVELAEDAMKDAVTQTAKAVRKELVTTSPDGKTGRYRKGWRASVVEEKAHMRHMSVHNRKYQIVHLLERDTPSGMAGVWLPDRTLLRQRNTVQRCWKP